MAIISHLTYRILRQCRYTLLIEAQEYTRRPGTTTTAHVTLSEALFGKVSAAVEADLIERALPESSAAVSGNGFSVKVDAKGIATVKVTVNR